MSFGFILKWWCGPLRYTANLMINPESTIMLPYFFVCLAKVSELVGCFYFAGVDVGVAVLDIVAVLYILECLVVLDILFVLDLLVVLDILVVIVNLGCLVEPSCNQLIGL